MGIFLTEEKFAEISEQNRQEAEAAGEPYDPAEFLQTLADNGYEIENYNFEFSFGEQASNLGPSVKELGKNVVAALANPRQTGSALSSLAKGALRSGVEAIYGENTPMVFVSPFGGGAFTPTEEDEELFDTFVETYKDRLGFNGVDRALNAWEKDPGGMMSDLSVFLTGGLGAVRGAATTTANVAGQGTRLADIAGSVAATAGRGAELARYVDPLVAGTKVTASAGRVFSDATGLTQALKDFTTKSMRKTIGMPPGMHADIVEKFNLGLGEGPGAFLSKYDIHGSFRSMLRKTRAVEQETVKIVDAKLAPMPDLVKNRDARVIIDVLRKNLEDTVTEKIPGQGGDVSQTLRVARENLSTDQLQDLNRLKQLREKWDAQGLTASDMVELKRILDRRENPFKQGGDIKSGTRSESLGTARARMNQAIDRIAKKNGVDDYLDLNKQTATAGALTRYFEHFVNSSAETTTGFEKIKSFLLYGTTGAVLGGGSFASGMSTLESLGIGTLGVAGLKLLNTPSVRSYLSVRFRMLSEGERKLLLGGVDVRSGGKKVRDLLRRERRRLYKTFPELRLATIVKEIEEETFGASRQNERNQQRINRQATPGGVK